MRAAIALLVAAQVLACGGASRADPTIPDAKVALASQYLAVTHYEDILRQAWAKELKLSMKFCRDSACQKDLDQAVDESFAERIPAYVQGFANLLATRLSEADLRAAISFSQSPNGQAIARAQQDVAEQYGELGNDLSISVYADVSRSFCSRHHDICVASTTTAPAR